MVSSMLNSSNLVFATAMVVSSTAVILAYLRQNKPDISAAAPPISDSHTSRQADVQILRPCLSSGGKKERKKKKVQFAENVVKKKKGTEGDNNNNNNNNNTNVEELIKKKTERKLKKIRCRSAFSGINMPENRIALYNGILRDRSHRMGFSY